MFGSHLLSIHLGCFYDGHDFCHTAEEDEQVATFCGRVLAVNQLQDADVGGGV